MYVYRRVPLAVPCPYVYTHSGYDLRGTRDEDTRSSVQPRRDLWSVANRRINSDLLMVVIREESVVRTGYYSCDRA